MNSNSLQKRFGRHVKILCRTFGKPTCFLPIFLCFFSLSLIGEGEVFHFDTPPDIRRFLPNLKNPESYFDSVRKAAGNGALRTNGISRSFPSKQKIATAGFCFYDNSYEIKAYNNNTPSLTFTFSKQENGKERNVVYQILRNDNGWQLRYTEPNKIRRFHRLTEAYIHGGWIRIDAVKAENKDDDAPFLIFMNGHEIFRTPESYTFIKNLSMEGFPSLDEFRADSDPRVFHPNPVSKIFPKQEFGTVILNPDETLTVELNVIRTNAKEKNGVIELTLLDGRGETVSTCRTPVEWDKIIGKTISIELPKPPRSGNYFLESRYFGKEGYPIITARKINVQIINPQYSESKEFAPIPLSETMWDFLPVGSFDPRIHPLTIQNPSGKEFIVPPAPPSDWSKSEKIRGEWMNLSAHFKIGQSWYAGWYRQILTVPKAWQGKKIKLLIDDPMTIANVFVNGKRISEIEWPGGTADLTGMIKPGRKTELAIHVQGNPLYGYYKELSKIIGSSFRPPSLSWRGLPGDVILYPAGKSEEIEHVSIRPSVRENRLDAVYECSGLIPGTAYSLRGVVSSAGKTVKILPEKRFTAKNTHEKILLSAEWKNPILWELNEPYLYDLNGELCDANGKTLDRSWQERFGFREVYPVGSVLYLNRRPVTLFDSNGCAVDSPGDSKKQEMLGFSSYYHYTGSKNAQILDESGKSAGKDYHFLPVSRMAVELARVGKSEDPRFWNAAKRIIEHQIKQRENHPGIFFHYGPMGGGMAENGGIYNTLFANGTWYNRKPGSRVVMDSLKAGFKIYSILKQSDPTRMITSQDSGSLNDSMMITEYCGFQQIQEMIERADFWRKISNKPMAVSEQAAPFQANWTDACSQGKGWGGVPCFHEWSAITRGNDAMSRTGLDRNYLIFLEKETESKRISARKKAKNPVLGDLAAKKIRMTSQPHGNYETSNETVSFKITCERIREQVFFWRASYLSLLNFQYVPVSGLGRTLITQEVQAPVTGFLAGTKGKITAKNHNFRPGELLERGAVLLNNTHKPQEISCQWSLEFDGQGKAHEEVTKTIPPGGQTFVPFSYRIPVDEKDSSGSLTVSFFRDGKFLRKDSYSIDILKQNTPPSEFKIALVDPEFATAKEFDRLGIPYRFLMFDEDFSPYDLIVFGRRAFRYEMNLLPEGLDLGILLRNGKKILVMEQDENTLRERFRFRTEYSSSRDVFGRLSGETALLKGLPDRVLRYWRGTATLTDGYAPAREKKNPLGGEFGNGGTWNYLWNDGTPHNRPMKWGNTHAVATVTVIKPDSSHFRTLIDCEYGLQYAAALELECGRGRIVFNQLDVCGRSESDPAADRYLNNLIRYSANFKPEIWRSVFYLGDAGGADLLKHLNVPFQKIKGKNLQNPMTSILILGDPGTGNLREMKDSLSEFVKQGGILFSLRKTAAQFSENWTPFTIRTEQKKISDSAIGRTQNPLLKGLGNSDFFWKGNLNLTVITDAGRNSVGTASGIVTSVPYGKGRYVFCQVEPGMFGDVEVNHWLKPSRHGMMRMMRTLLSNLKTAMPDPILVNPPKSALKHAFTLNLAGTWQIAKGELDSEEAPAKNSKEWRSIRLPGSPQKTYPEWSARKGRFWFRRTYRPEREMPGNAETRLQIGCVSGANRLWINGKLAGVTDTETDVNTVAGISRDYAIPTNLLKNDENEFLMRVDFETDAALGMKDSTGDILAPFEVRVFTGKAQGNIPSPILLDSRDKWWGHPVASAAEGWKSNLRKRIAVPGQIQDQHPEWGSLTGYFRYHREFLLTDPLPENISPALMIGCVDDEDTVWFNGVKIGHTGKDTNPNNYWMVARNYPIPKELFRTRKNEIQILVRDFNVGGGILKGPVELVFEAPETTQKRKLEERPYYYDVNRSDDPYWHHGF